MSEAISLRSPAKINWTLEVLAKRDDGYHEVRTILQTVALSDTISVRPSDGVELEVTGDAGLLANQPVEENLAYRAAQLLMQECSVRAGARITLDKRIPVAAGLGGGSSNAAATLRALRSLWRLSITTGQLAAIGAKLGSDVPFFLLGGTAIGRGRGDELTPVPNVRRRRLVLGWPKTDRTDKTAQMYATLTAEDYADGNATDRAAEQLPGPLGARTEDITNVFQSVIGRVDEDAAQALADAHALGSPHLAGSGPSFFFLLAPTEPATAILRGLSGMGIEAIETRTISATEATEAL